MLEMARAFGKIKKENGKYLHTLLRQVVLYIYQELFCAKVGVLDAVFFSAAGVRKSTV